MSRKKKYIPKRKLYSLYHTKNLSPKTIGRHFNCDEITIRNRLIEYGIPLKSQSFARQKYCKQNFDGSDCEKAYMLGFRIGDLNVYVPYKNSEIIVVRCHSTRTEQIDVVKRLFSQYGHITESISADNKNIHANCYLNKSFFFLIDKFSKSVHRWLLSDVNRAFSFMAGYIDAEGNFQINQGRARFKMDSYDYDVLLFFVRNVLSFYSFDYKFYCIAKKGVKKKRGGRWNQNLWRVTINSADDLYKFTVMLLPFLKHEGRKKDAKIVLSNIERRKENGTV